MSWTHTVEAYNTAVDSTNRMHDDAVAQTFGFRGGLVPGVDVWAYMTRPCLDSWGRDFLTRSAMEARFVSPVYDGEVVVAELAEDGARTVTGRHRAPSWASTSAKGTGSWTSRSRSPPTVHRCGVRFTRRSGGGARRPAATAAAA